MLKVVITAGPHRFLLEKFVVSETAPQDDPHGVAAEQIADSIKRLIAADPRFAVQDILN